MEHTKTSHNHNPYTYNNGTVNVPFSWEYKPGHPKVTHQNGIRHATNLVLQPPPCSLYGTGTGSSGVEDTQIPLGPRAVQNLLRISSFRMESQKDQEDPFVEAYKKCTKSPFVLQGSNKQSKKNNTSGSWPSIRKYMHILSCKYTCDVSSGKSVYTYKM